MTQRIERPIGTMSREGLMRPRTTATPAAPSALAAPPNALALLQALKRRWRLALLVTPVSTVLAAALIYFLVPGSKFTARAQLQIASQGTSILDKQNQLAFTTYQQNQLVLLKSRIVLETTLQRPEIAALPTVRQQPHPVEWLEKELQVESAPGSEIMKVSLNGDIADDLPILVQAVCDSYLTLIVNRDQIQKKAELAQLQELWDGYEVSLASKRAEVKRLADDVGSKDTAILAQKQKFAQDALNAYQRELLKSQSELRTGRIELSSLKAREQVEMEVVVPDYLVDQAMRADPVIQGYYRDLAKLQEEIKVTESRFQPGRAGPYTAEARRQLGEVEQLIAGYRTRLRPSVEAEAREKARHAYKSRLIELETKVKDLEEQEKGLQGQMDKLSTQTQTIQRSSADLETKMTAIAKEEAVVKKLGEKMEALNVGLHDPSRVTLLEEAVVTRSRNEKKPQQMAIAGGLGALGATLFGISWWEFLARRVHGVEEVAQGLGLRVLGTLPEAPASARRLGAAPPSDRYHHALVLESADAMRAALLHAARSEGARSVLVTSAVSGEGKTTLATQLAASLARAGLRTLLVDGDLRNPSAHAVFGMPATAGLSEVLRGETALTSAIHPTPTEGLWLLAAGQADGRAIAALMSDRVGPVLGGLKKHYDFVVIDASPVLPVGDALSLGQHADAVVLAVRREVSQLRKVYQACQRLNQFGLRVLGVGVNGIREEVYGKAYHTANEMKLVQDTQGSIPAGSPAR